MSIQSPVGTLDIKNATLRVGKLEDSDIQGVDTALNVTRANSVLIYDDQASTTTFTGGHGYSFTFNDKIWLKYAFNNSLPIY